ncbi:hypothetical protein LG58_2702 [Kosakonia radicincitans YD4]|jgi:hypothetical protein|uniref:Uncharacterized protein n=1 Tax=Kosakonia oryzae TaxID=497725 RepID=A0AA94H0S6_9ENTR|nr:hypothetical protein LG58_2702 [Kosakonia radicincitans YD4]SFB69798.1 hypothetical protein SAMN05216286_0367 [Kosakonia oryzae]
MLRLHVPLYYVMQAALCLSNVLRLEWHLRRHVRHKEQIKRF